MIFSLPNFAKPELRVRDKNQRVKEATNIGNSLPINYIFRGGDKPETLVGYLRGLRTSGWYKMVLSAVSTMHYGTTQFKVQRFGTIFGPYRRGHY